MSLSIRLVTVMGTLCVVLTPEMGFYTLHYSNLFRISLSTKADNFIKFVARALMTGRHNIHAILHCFTSYHFSQCV